MSLVYLVVQAHLIKILSLPFPICKAELRKLEGTRNMRKNAEKSPTLAKGPRLSTIPSIFFLLILEIFFFLLITGLVAVKKEAEDKIRHFHLQINFMGIQKNISF